MTMQDVIDSLQSILDDYDIDDCEGDMKTSIERLKLDIEIAQRRAREAADGVEA